MANLVLYRRFYMVEDVPNTNSDNYTLIDPYDITATSSGSTGVIETLDVAKESTGVYYVELDPILYNFTDIFHVVWLVQYNSISPQRKLFTSFRLNPYNITREIEIEVVSTVGKY